MFHYFRVSKHFMFQKVMSLFSIFCRKFIVSHCQKDSQVNRSVLFLRKFPVAKKFMDKRGGEYQNSPSKIFCLTVPINFVGEILNVALITGTEKVWIRRGSIKIFRGNFFSFRVPKSFVGEAFSVSLISGNEKSYASEGYVAIFVLPSEVFCLTVPKSFAGEPFSTVFQEISGSGKVYG